MCFFVDYSLDDRGDKSVNNLYLQVSSGHCENTLHSSSSSMDMLRASPPVQFIEVRWCHKAAEMYTCCLLTFDWFR